MEDPSRFDPATQQRKRRKCHGSVKEWMCGDHRKEGWLKGGEPCPGCVREHKSNSVNINTGNAYAGWYEHIGPQPIWCNSKQDLYRACVKHGASARALMSGGVMKRPRGA